jgi:hypothetical protein
MNINLAQIERNIQQLAENPVQKDSFVYDLMRAYGIERSIISRLQNGSLNKATHEGAVVWNTMLYFLPVEDSAQLQDAFELMRLSDVNRKYKPRFIIATDFETLLAYDTKAGDTLDTTVTDLPLNIDYFRPWAGIEKYIAPEEARADLTAAGRMAKLYEQLLKDNPTQTVPEVHALNIFLTRLLFCYFAEDTEIFEKKLFTNTIAFYTSADSSDTASCLEQIFDILNTQKRGEDTPVYLVKFPFVNGGLFREKYPIPRFTARTRRLVMDCAKLNWSEINPDIFGSMIQAVITPEHRGGLGMHYTSVPNIMKVIEPLFLNDLRAEFEKQKGNIKGLYRLLNRLYKLKIFDPACGSGNFLIIAYKELRKLEMEIFKQITLLTNESSLSFTHISLTQFYGIEIDDFAHEVATLSLWLAEHQMNVLFTREFGRSTPPLPLKASGNIVCGNATRLNWQQVCPRTAEDEVYILGNPPYLGARLQSDEQKEDMDYVFNGINGFNNLDYISCWFYLGAKYIESTNSKYAFVTTNSICQGEQVSTLWRQIMNFNLEIFFAYSSFKWKNNAKANAGVTCTIIGMRKTNGEAKYLYKETIKTVARNINAFLIEANNVFIDKRTKPISNLPEMSFGSMPNDNGQLLLSPDEAKQILDKNPQAKPIVKRILGSHEFIRGEDRYCLWINEESKELAYSIPEIAVRIERCRIARASSKREATNKLAITPHLFGEVRHIETNSIIIPCHSSEKREYIPMGFISSDTVISNSAQAIYDAKAWVFGVVTSRMHMVWVRAMAGRLEERLRYSAQFCYNTFPFPQLSERQKEIIEVCVDHILRARAYHGGMTNAQRYDPEKMPDNLREAHSELDLAIERIYRSRPFESDEERLAYLFELYEKMIKTK